MPLNLSPIEIAPKHIFDASETARVHAHALGLLGFQLTDYDKQTLLDDFTALNVQTATAQFQGLPVTGEPTLSLPYSVVSTAELIARIDAVEASETKRIEFPKTYVYPNLWTPGTETNSYTDEDLGAASGKLTLARLMLNNPNNQSTNRGNQAEPLLHFLNQPFDSKNAKRGDITQLQSVIEASEHFTAINPELSLRATTHREVALLALIRRIKGEPMPVNWGFMRDANHTRKEVGGGSVVGGVRSFVGRFRLGGSYGSACPSVGVGLSAGLKAHEA